MGYYQNTEYDNEDMKEQPPSKVQFERLVRDISTKPRVTRFQIKWCVTCSSCCLLPFSVCSPKKLKRLDDDVGTLYQHRR